MCSLNNRYPHYFFGQGSDAARLKRVPRTEREMFLKNLPAGRKKADPRHQTASKIARKRYKEDRVRTLRGYFSRWRRIFSDTKCAHYEKEIFVSFGIADTMSAEELLFFCKTENHPVQW